MPDAGKDGVPCLQRGDFPFLLSSFFPYIYNNVCSIVLHQVECPCLGFLLRWFCQYALNGVGVWRCALGDALLLGCVEGHADEGVE